MPDEHVQPQLSFSYDAKRDRWNGYNLDEHATIIEEHTKVEMAKRKLKAEKLQEELLSGKLPEGSVKVYIYLCYSGMCFHGKMCTQLFFLELVQISSAYSGISNTDMCESYRA